MRIGILIIYLNDLSASLGRLLFSSDGNRELIANIDRLDEFMVRAELAAVVARSGRNFTYLSGLAFPDTLARHLEFPDSERGVTLALLHRLVQYPGEAPFAELNAASSGSERPRVPAIATA